MEDGDAGFMDFFSCDKVSVNHEKSSDMIACEISTDKCINSGRNMKLLKNSENQVESISKLLSKEIVWNLPGYILFKNLSSTFVGANKNLSKLLGFQCTEELIGLTDYDVKCEAKKLAYDFIKQDRDAMDGEDVVNIDISKYADRKIHVFLTQRSAWIDSEGKLIGVIASSIEIQKSTLHCVAYRFSDIQLKYSIGEDHAAFGSYKLNGLYQDYKLTSKESECLFYLLRGYTAKEIAKKSGNISPRTIEKHFERIKMKFSCKTRYQLINKTINLGFFSCVPETLLTTD